MANNNYVKVVDGENKITSIRCFGDKKAPFAIAEALIEVDRSPDPLSRAVVWRLPSCRDTAYEWLRTTVPCDDGQHRHSASHGNGTACVRCGRRDTTGVTLTGVRP